MPMTRNQADSIITRLHITFDGTDGDLNLTYRPNLLSRDEFRRMQEIAEGGEDADDQLLAPLLSRALVGWDFLQEPEVDEQGNVIRQGEPYPITPDTVSLLGYPLQIQVVRQMVGGPTPTNGRSSARGSAEKRLMPPIEHSSSPASDTSTGESMRPY